jgi:hypothetical protein
MSFPPDVARRPIGVPEDLEVVYASSSRPTWHGARSGSGRGLVALKQGANHRTGVVLPITFADFSDWGTASRNL